jgi:hypothetical protein
MWEAIAEIIFEIAGDFFLEAIGHAIMKAANLLFGRGDSNGLV